MKILDLFKSRKSRAKLSHLKHLMRVANADGHVSKEEINAIVTVCHRDNISERDIERAIKEPESIDLVIPKTIEEKIIHLKDVVALMMCDSDIHENEIHVCKQIAILYGFSPMLVDEIIVHIIDDLAAKVDADLAKFLETQMKIINKTL